MTRDPATAPPRADLPFLRHRSLRVTHAPASGDLAEFMAGHAHHQTQHPAPAPAPARTPTPALAPAPAPTPIPAPASSSLDLDDRPATAPVPPTPSSSGAATSSLDLDDAPAAPAPRRVAQPTRPAVARKPPVTRVPTTGRLVLDAATPSATLTRVQSGIGTLAIDAACGADIGDLRIGCAYRLTDGATSVISTIGERLAPSDSRHPVLFATHEQFQRIVVDLRDVRTVERFMVYAFSESRSSLDWGGTVLVTTHAGARVEAPLIGLDAGSVGVLLSAYQADGELSLWTEMLAGTSVRDACRAFGFDDITWVDDRTPVH